MNPEKCEECPRFEQRMKDRYKETDGGYIMFLEPWYCQTCKSEYYRSLHRSTNSLETRKTYKNEE